MKNEPLLQHNEYSGTRSNFLTCKNKTFESRSNILCLPVTGRIEDEKQMKYLFFSWSVIAKVTNTKALYKHVDSNQQ